MTHQYSKLKVKYSVPQFRLMKCVYRLRIGDKFYIGRTRQLNQRVQAHLNGIQCAMNNYNLLNLYRRHRDINEPNRKISCYYYEKMAKYIFEHPNIDTIYVDVLYYSPHNKNISIVERSFLRHFENHKDCFNATFNTGLDFSIQYEYGVKKVGNFIYYYELTNPNELIPCNYNLYPKQDSWNKPRPPRTK